MYRKDNPNQMKFKNFYLSFGGELSGENRWVILAQQIPWQQIEQDYSELFSNDEGCPAKAARVGFGAMIIKERLELLTERLSSRFVRIRICNIFWGFTNMAMKLRFITQ